MRNTTMVRTLALILPLAAPLPCPGGTGFSEHFCRRCRAPLSEQKKASTKPATIITMTPDPAPTPAPAAATNAPTASSPPSPQKSCRSYGSNTATRMRPPPPMKRKEEEGCGRFKQQVAALQGEVDLVQRSLSLDQELLFQTRLFNDKDGKAKLDAEQADLKQKQDDLAQLKAKLAGLGGVEEPKAPTPPAKP